MSRGEGTDRRRGSRPPPATEPPSLPWLAAFGPLEVLAVIWATVDLERALADLRGAGGGPSGALDTAEALEDPLLGARVLIVDRPPPHADRAGPRIALAEPSTEGRLAGILARNGEGPAGWYVRSPAGLDDLRSAAAAGSAAVTRPAAGPLGASVLILGGSAAGPHVILVDPAAVPSPP